MIEGAGLIMPQCHACNLSMTRKKQVPGKGVLPCDVLIIGEGPGKSEDTRGLPFYGKAGEILEDAMSLFSTDLPSYFITNVVWCRPCDDINGPNRQPTDDEALACNPNLMKIYRMAKPKTVVLLGKVAARYTVRLFDCPVSRFDHPAYIARKGGKESPLFLALARGLHETFEGVRKCQE